MVVGVGMGMVVGAGTVVTGAGTVGKVNHGKLVGSQEGLVVAPAGFRGSGGAGSRGQCQQGQALISRRLVR